MAVIYAQHWHDYIQPGITSGKRRNKPKCGGYSLHLTREDAESMKNTLVKIQKEYQQRGGKAQFDIGVAIAPDGYVMALNVPDDLERRIASVKREDNLFKEVYMWADQIVPYVVLAVDS